MFFVEKYFDLYYKRHQDETSKRDLKKYFDFVSETNSNVILERFKDSFLEFESSLDTREKEENSIFGFVVAAIFNSASLSDVSQKNRDFLYSLIKKYDKLLIAQQTELNADEVRKKPISILVSKERKQNALIGTSLEYFINSPTF